MLWYALTKWFSIQESPWLRLHTITATLAVFYDVLAEFRRSPLSGGPSATLKFHSILWGSSSLNLQRQLGFTWKLCGHGKDAQSCTNPQWVCDLLFGIFPNTRNWNFALPGQIVRDLPSPPNRDRWTEVTCRALRLHSAPQASLVSASKISPLPRQNFYKWPKMGMVRKPGILALHPKQIKISGKWMPIHLLEKVFFFVY